MQPYRPQKGQAVRSAPGRDQAESGLYTRISSRRNPQKRPERLSRRRPGAQPVVDRPDLVGKADRHRGAIAQALRPRRFEGEVLVAVERVEELLQASGEQHLLESRIGMRARKLRFVNHMIHG